MSTTKKIRKNSFGEDIIHRQVRGQVIVVACRVCGNSEEMDRKAVVKRHGASIPMRTLRRRMGLGCERMNAVDGIDKCQLAISAKSQSNGGLSMTDNVVSFEDRRLARLDGMLFSSSDEEVKIASTIARLEARIKERDTVRDYIERMETGEIMLHPDDGNAPSPLPLAQLLDLLSGYDEMLSAEIDRLEVEKETLHGPYQD